MARVDSNLIAAISPRTGIIRALIEIPHHHDDPKIYNYGALMADTSRYSAHQCSLRNGGAGLTRMQAIGAAIGEALERYCCNFYCQEALQLGSFIDLNEQAIEPSTFALYSEKQRLSGGFPYSEFKHETKIKWIEATSLISNRTKLVPASMVYLPYYRAQGETNICPSISTGLACGDSFLRAILSGIYECIERDAFTIYWLNAIRAPRIDPDKIFDDQLRNIFFTHFARPGIQYFIWDITLDIAVPTFFCVALGSSNVGQLFCVGTASHLDARQALLKSLIEACQGRSYLRAQRVCDPDWHCKDDFSNIRSFDDHARVYTECPELLSYLGFCTTVCENSVSMRRNESTNDMQADLGKLLSTLNNLGFDVLVIDLTTEDVRELGLHVVRVVIPGLQPLHGDHRYPFLGGERLYEIPFRLGLRNCPLTEEEVFKLPHPFP